MYQVQKKLLHKMWGCELKAKEITQVTLSRQAVSSGVSAAQAKPTWS